MSEYINGSIPCCGCCTNIVRGIVYKTPGGEYICEDCYDNATEIEVKPNENLEQFEEYDK